MNMVYVRFLFKKIANKTGRYYCPVCDNKIKSFIALSNKITDKYLRYKHDIRYETLNYKQYTCPICNSSDRDRLIAIYIKKNIGIKDKINMIEFAPNIATKKMLSKYKNITYRTADLFMNYVDDKVDITKLDIYKNQSFDIFICSHVLEHVRNDKMALSELNRILKINGFGIIMVPIALNRTYTDEDFECENVDEKWKRFGQEDHVRLYSKNGFIKSIEESCFILKMYGFEYFGEDTLSRAGIDNGSVLYVVTKQ